MPAFLTAVVSSIGAALGGTTGAFLIMNAGAVAAGVLVAGYVGFSAYQADRAKKKARDAYNASQVDRLANVVTTVAPRELALGRVRKGGPVIFRGSAGALKETFLVHLALAGHEIDGVEAVYLNDQEVTLAADGSVLTAPYYQERKVSAKAYIYAPGTSVTLPFSPVAGSVTAHVPTSDSGIAGYGMSSGALAITVAGNLVTLQAAATGTVEVNYQYIEGTSYAKVWWDLGAGTAVADARTLALFPGLWTSAHRGQGVAKLIAEFTYNETAFPSGIPAITARVRGAKVYDPRSGLTAFSENPALLARHVYQHSHFGKAVVSADEDVRFAAVANLCDVDHDYVVGGSTETHNLYRAGLVAPFGAAASPLLDDLCQAMAGMWAFAGGELHIRAGVYSAPVMTLTEADLAVVQRSGDSESQDPMSIVVHRERAEKFNVVNARIWDGGQDYKMVALSPVKASGLIARDGQELAQEVEFPAVSYAPQAQHVAGVLMRDARDPLVFEAPWKMRAWPLELFDTVSATVARYGWTDKSFAVINRVWDHERAVVRLTLKETGAAIYTPDAEFLPQGYAANTALPNPWDIVPPVLTTAGIYSGTTELLVQADGTILTRVRVTWIALADQTITSGGQIEVQWSPVGSTAWQSVLVDGGASQAYIVGARDGSAIVIRARSLNSLATSDWSAQVTHVVVGKTEPPEPVSRFKLIEQPGGIKQFFWEKETAEVDLTSFVVRYVLGSVERPWDEMITLFAKGKNAREHETTEPRNDDTYTFAICAVDSSGNYSEPAYVTETLDGDAFGSVSLLILPYEDGWPGTKTDCYVSGAVLVAGAGTWNDLNVTWASLASVAWNNITGAGSIASIVYEHPAVDLGVSAPRTIRANSLSSGATTIEYASSADGVSYSAWAEVPAGAVTDRYFKFRWTVNGTSPVLYRAQAVFYE